MSDAVQIQDTIQKEKLIEREKIKRRLLGRFRKAILECVNVLTMMKLTPDEIIEKQVFPQRPFQRGKLAVLWLDLIK